MSDSKLPPTPSRKDYTEDPLYKVQAEGNAQPIFHRDDPIKLFGDWMSDARHLEPNDANAMSLATVDKVGIPDVRIVLLKSFDEAGFVFYSNGHSSKGEQLAANPVGALCFHWKSLRRQVRIRGDISPVSESKADDYFASRARGSQIGAVASEQSQPLESREYFENRLVEIENKYENQPVPRPAHWGGWRVTPKTIEFWRDRPFRLHDRLVFTAAGKRWTKERLFP